jgi:hypothetical protein
MSDFLKGAGPSASGMFCSPGFSRQLDHATVRTEATDDVKCPQRNRACERPRAHERVSWAVHIMLENPHYRLTENKRKMLPQVRHQAINSVVEFRGGEPTIITSIRDILWSMLVS